MQDFGMLCFISTFIDIQPKPKKLSNDDYIMVYHCYNCSYDIIFDTMPFSLKTLEPEIRPTEKGKDRDLVEIQGNAKKLVIKQILSKQETSKPAKSNSLDLSSFLKKLG